MTSIGTASIGRCKKASEIRHAVLAANRFTLAAWGEYVELRLLVLDLGHFPEYAQDGTAGQRDPQRQQRVTAYRPSARTTVFVERLGLEPETRLGDTSAGHDGPGHAHGSAEIVQIARVMADVLVSRAVVVGEKQRS